MDERLKFIARLLDGEKMAVVCREYVRQLQNAIRHVAVVGKSGVVTPELFPPPLNGIGDTPTPNRVAETASNAGPSNPTTESTDAIRPLWVVEKEMIEKAVDACDGNIPRAAALLELSPSTIYRKRQKTASG